MNEWAKKLVKGKNERRESERLRNEKILSDRKMIEGNAETQWNHINNLIVEYLKDLNTENGSVCLEVSYPSESVTMIKEVGRAQESSSITWNTMNTTIRVPFDKCELKLCLNPHDEFVWKSTEYNGPVYSSKQVAMKTIEQAWNSVR